MSNNLTTIICVAMVCITAVVIVYRVYGPEDNVNKDDK